MSASVHVCVSRLTYSLTALSEALAEKDARRPENIVHVCGVLSQSRQGLSRCDPLVTWPHCCVAALAVLSTATRAVTVGQGAWGKDTIRDCTDVRQARWWDVKGGWDTCQSISTQVSTQVSSLVKRSLRSSSKTKQTAPESVKLYNTCVFVPFLY